MSKVRLLKTKLYTTKIKDYPVEVSSYIVFDSIVNRVRVCIYLDSRAIASYIDTLFAKRISIKIKSLGKTLPVSYANRGEGAGITS